MKSYFEGLEKKLKKYFHKIFKKVPAVVEYLASKFAGS